MFNKLDSMIGIGGEKCNGFWLPFVLPVVTGHILERRSVWRAINLSWVIRHCWGEEEL